MEALALIIGIAGIVFVFFCIGRVIGMLLGLGSSPQPPMEQTNNIYVNNVNMTVEKPEEKHRIIDVN